MLVNNSIPNASYIYFFNLQNYNDKILFNKNIYLIHCKSICKKITICYHSKTRGTNNAKTKKRYNQY